MDSTAPDPAECRDESPRVVVARATFVILFVLACSLKIATARMMTCDAPAPAAEAASAEPRLAGR